LSNQVAPLFCPNPFLIGSGSLETVPAQHRFVAPRFKRNGILFPTFAAGNREIAPLAHGGGLLGLTAIWTPHWRVGKTFVLVKLLLPCRPGKLLSAIFAS